MYQNALHRRTKYQQILNDVSLPLSAMQGLELYLPKGIWAHKEEETMRGEDGDALHKSADQMEQQRAGRIFDFQQASSEDDDSNNFFITHVKGIHEETSEIEHDMDTDEHHEDTYFAGDEQQQLSAEDQGGDYDSPQLATTPKLFQHQKDFQHSLRDHFQRDEHGDSGSAGGATSNTIAATMDAVLAAGISSSTQNRTFVRKSHPFHKYERALQRVTLPKIQHRSNSTGRTRRKRKKTIQAMNDNGEAKLTLTSTAPVRSRPTEFLNPKKFRSIDQLERINDTRALGVREHMMKIARARIQQEVALQDQRRKFPPEFSGAMANTQTKHHLANCGNSHPTSTHRSSSSIMVIPGHAGDFLDLEGGEELSATVLPNTQLFEELADTSRRDVVQRAMQTTKTLREGGRVERIQKRFLTPIIPKSLVVGGVGHLTDDPLSGDTTTANCLSQHQHAKSLVELVREMIPLDPVSQLPNLSIEQTMVE